MNTLVRPDEFAYDVLDASNYDGDSVRLLITRQFDFGGGFTLQGEKRVSVRIDGIDTPELRDKRPEWKAAAYRARDAVSAWIDARMDYGGFVFVSTTKPDKYGRWLGDLVCTESGERLTEFLLRNRLAVAYHGQNKADVEAAHAENIAWLNGPRRTELYGG